MLNNSLLQKAFNFVYEHFKKDTSKMLVITGTLGWALSSLAQIGAVVVNPKISSEKKSFLIPQEFMDAVINVGAFFGITMIAKKSIAKMASTGKITTAKVRNYLNKNKELYGDKVGKIDFDLDEVLKKDNQFPAHSYYTHKNFITTVGTVGASVLSCNIVTPIVRNAMASRVQKSYIDYKKNANPYQTTNYKSDMKI